MSAEGEPFEVPPAPGASRPCPKCGQENPAANRFCFCGFDFERDVFPEALSTAPARVGGWLLFFCVQVVIIAPLMAARSAWTSIGDVQRDPFFYKTAAGMVLLGQELIDLVVTLVGLWAGIALWRIVPGALRRARIYLVILGCVHFLLPVAWSVLPVPEGIAPWPLASRVIAALGALLRSTVWWLYFARSRRVQATYLIDREAIRAFD